MHFLVAIAKERSVEQRFVNSRRLRTSLHWARLCKAASKSHFHGQANVKVAALAVLVVRRFANCEPDGGLQGATDAHTAVGDPVWQE